MLSEIRQQKLMDMVLKHGAVTIRELSDRFEVSEETIRRDLRKLEQAGLIKRTHGGAVLNEEFHIVPHISQRREQNMPEKVAIAEAAVGLVHDGASVMLDSGTTTLQVAKKLAQGQRNVTVITHDLTIAMEVAPATQVELVVLGGVQQKGTFSLVGHECENMVRRYHADFVFLGTGGISLRHGLTTGSGFEAEVKKLMIQSGTYVYCLADASKIGKAALVSYASVADVDAIITNDSADRQAMEELQRQGATFVLTSGEREQR